MADKPVWKAAEEAADTMRGLYHRADGQVNLAAMCAALNIRVLHTPDLPPETSGLIVKTADNEVTRVYVNATEPPTRQRFTLAHEIGHFMERTTVARDFDFSFRDQRRSDSYDLHEFYADQFAGALLMPFELLLRDFPELDNPATDSVTWGLLPLRIAAGFNVSPAAARSRLRRLVSQGMLREPAA